MPRVAVTSDLHLDTGGHLTSAATVAALVEKIRAAEPAAVVLADEKYVNLFGMTTKRRGRRPRSDARVGPPQRASVFIEALIEKTPGIVGGSACITRTRIPVWTLESYRRLGATTQQIVEAFPTLRPLDLRAARLYAARHEAEIDREIDENETA